MYLFSCDKSILSWVVNSLSNITSNLHSSPQSCIKFSCDVGSQKVKAVACDADVLEVFIEFDGKVEKDGVFLFPPKQNKELVRSLPNSEVNIGYDTDNNLVEIGCGNTQIKLNTLFSDLFQELSSIVKPKEDISFIEKSVPKDVFRSALVGVSCAVASEINYEHNKVRFFSCDGDIKAVAIDGHRMAVYCFNKEDFSDLPYFSLPWTALAEFIRLSQSANDNFTFRFSEKIVEFELLDKKSKITLKTIPNLNDSFDFNKITSKETNKALSFEINDFLQVLKHLSPLAQKEDNYVELTMNRSSLYGCLLATNHEGAVGQEEFNGEFASREDISDEVKIAFNYKYVAEPLGRASNLFGATTATMEFDDPTKVIKMSFYNKDKDKTNYEYVFMPMYLCL